MPIYGSVITNAGDALVAAALAGGDPVELATLVIGDANGEDHLPTASQTALVNQVYQVALASLSVDSENPNQLLATAIIPAEIGGWDIRELGVKTLDGVLFAVSNFSPARKPIAAEGSLWVMELTVAIAVASTSAITIVVDPEIDYATKQWVIDNFEPKGAGGAWVPITRNLVAGPGIVGGGSLTADRMFAADKPWFDMRYSPIDHNHDGRYAPFIHSHPTAIANGAGGFLSGADKAKLDGLGAAGMRIIATASASGVNFVDLTLPGPFHVLMWAMRYNSAAGEDFGPWAHISDTQGVFPPVSQAGYGRPQFPIGLTKPVGATNNDPINGMKVGAGMLFYNGLSIHHRSDYTADFSNQYFSPPAAGQNRYMRIYLFTSRTIDAITTAPFAPIEIIMFGA